MAQGADMPARGGRRNPGYRHGGGQLQPAMALAYTKSPFRGLARSIFANARGAQAAADDAARHFERG